MSTKLTKIHSFPPHIQEQLFDLGYDRARELFKTAEFCAWLEANPIPAGDSYEFEFDNGDAVGLTSNGPRGNDRHHGVFLNWGDTN